MVVRIVLVAVFAALAGLRTLHVSNEPVSPCHTRASSVDGSGRHVVSFTDRTGQDQRPSPISESVDSAVATLNSALTAVRLRESPQGDIQIIAARNGTIGRTDLTCSGDGGSGKATISLNSQFWTGQSTPDLQHDRLVAVLHEFGHALGLAHDADPCVVMHPTNSDCPPDKEIRFTSGEAQTIDGLYRSGPKPSPTIAFGSDVLPAPWPRG